MLFESKITTANALKSARLNPYSNGICSLRGEFFEQAWTRGGLNPYSNGICSLSEEITESEQALS